MRADIYQSLFQINQSLETAAEHLDKLKTAEVIRANGAEVRLLAIEELKADINATVTIAIHSVEMEASSRLEQERLAMENTIKGSE